MSLGNCNKIQQSFEKNKTKKKTENVFSTFLQRSAKQLDWFLDS